MKKCSIFLLLLAFSVSSLKSAVSLLEEIDPDPLTCTLDEYNELDDLFKDVSFSEKIKHLKELIVLRKPGSNDAAIMKKIEALICNTDLLNALPTCIIKSDIQLRSKQSMLKNEITIDVISEHGIHYINSRYELLELAIQYPFKELIKFIYTFVLPKDITDVEGAEECDPLLNDLEILLENVEYNDIEDMLDFLMGLKTDLRELRASYPEICREKEFTSAVVRKGCLLIDKEIERRAIDARKNFFNALEDLVGDDDDGQEDDDKIEPEIGNDKVESVENTLSKEASKVF